MTVCYRSFKRTSLAVALGLLLMGTAASAKAAPANDWDRDTTWREVRSFDQFLDSHHEAAQELWKHPNLVRKEKWCYRHPEFEEWARYNPRAADELRENPRRFMNRVREFEKHERGEGAYRDRDR